MKKPLLKLGKLLTTHEQKSINGGTDPWCDGIPNGAWCLKDGIMGVCRNEKCDLFAVGGSDGNEDPHFGDTVIIK
ncbi:MAG: hypothetical protein MK202_13615 [Tenacibaculum sp.]|nr:hypothetical protein [Tenacibaculum sp.]